MHQISFVSATRPAMFVCLSAVLGVSSAAWAQSGPAGGIVPQPRSGEPLPGLTPDQLDRFFKGRTQFMRDFTADEGLGPTFNQTSCAVCHAAPTPGGAGSISVTRFGALHSTTGVFDPLEDFGGSLHQAGTIFSEPGGLDCSDAVPTQEEIDDYFGNFEWNRVEINRITNAAFAAGLVEAIDDADLLAHAKWHGSDENGLLPHAGSPPPAPPGINSNIEGHAHKVTPLEDATPRVGRMGWKAQVATVLTFSADAARNEMGITNRFIGVAPAPKGDADLLALCENIPGINDMAPHPNDQAHLDPFGEDVEFIDRITHFQRFLAPPPQTPKSGMTGEQIFMDIGCGQCHIPSFTTRDDLALEDALRNKVIKPYSDFLLHNMGLQGDQVVQGDASGSEFRTPALWGLRDRENIMHNGQVSGGSFADRIFAAMQAHDTFGSKARPSARAFLAHPASPLKLEPHEQQFVIDFLNSLGRVEFDFTGDTIILDDDFAALIDCFTGTGGSYVTNPCDPRNPAPGCSDNPMDYPCAVFDINQDGLVDVDDFEVFLTVYDGFQNDCALWQQLADGVAPAIVVEIPRECQDLCLGDINDDGFVNVFDLLILLDGWGPNPGHPGDLNFDGLVDVFDLLILLENWGPCD